MTMTLEPPEVLVPEPTEPTLYWGLAEIGQLFGVPAHTIDQWRRRYTPDRVAEQYKRITGQDPTPEQIAERVCPAPDIILGVVRPNAGWDPATAEQRWRDWYPTRPGAGAGGGRPRTANPV